MRRVPPPPPSRGESRESRRRAKMAALCEAFTLCGLGPSGGVGQGGGVLALEPGPGPDHVLLTDRGRTATLFKVTPGTAQPRLLALRRLPPLRSGPGAPRSTSGVPRGALTRPRCPCPAGPAARCPPAAGAGSVGAPWARRVWSWAQRGPRLGSGPAPLTCAPPGPAPRTGAALALGGCLAGSFAHFLSPFPMLASRSSSGCHASRCAG